MNSIKFSKNELYINCNKVIFEQDILEVMKVGDLILVLLKIPVGEKGLDNLYCLSEKGDIVWRVKEPKEEYIGKMRFPYVGLNVDENQCSVIDFYGRKLYLSLNDGEIIGKDIVK